jgi:hypothetical protein
MFTHVPRNRARIEIIPASRRIADHQANGLAAIEFVITSEPVRGENQPAGEQENQSSESMCQETTSKSQSMVENF